MLDSAFPLLMQFLLLALGSGFLFGVIRLLKGPTAMDRLVAIEFLGGVSICTLIWMGIQFANPIVLDVALVIALLGFLSTCSMARWLEKEPT